MNDKGIYQNGVTAQQFNCHLNLSGTTLHIYLENDNKDLLIWDLQNIQSCHLNGASLILKYGSYPHQTLECSGEIANVIYKAWSQKHVIRRAEGFTFRKKYQSAILFILLFVGLSIFTLFYLLPWMGEKAANLVPIEAEVQLGNRLSAIYGQESNTNDSANYYAGEFVNNLDLEDTYHIDAKIITSDEINAFALPGGKIFIYSGIIEHMDSYKELVALLGHEVTHVVNRHSLKSICRSAATGIVVATVFGDVTGISSGIISQAEEFKQLDYSRDLETEADNNGVVIMTENKVDPQGMLDLLELLKKEGTQMPGLMKYLSTHPDTDSRIASVEANPLVKETFPENEKLKEIFKNLKRICKSGE